MAVAREISQVCMTNYGLESPEGVIGVVAKKREEVRHIPRDKMTEFLSAKREEYL